MEKKGTGTCFAMSDNVVISHAEGKGSLQE